MGYSCAIQYKYNEKPICNFLFSIQHIFKEHKMQQVRLSNNIFYLTPFIQNIISICKPPKITNERFSFLICVLSIQTPVCTYDTSGASQFRPVTFQVLHSHLYLVATLLDSEDIEHRLLVCPV